VTTRLAILSSHPIQYNAPAFRTLARYADLDAHVFYGWEGPGATIDPEFGRAVKWDVPLLDGYEHTFIPNASPDPGSHRFRGIDSPDVVAQIRAWQPDVLLVYGWAFASHLRVLRAFHGKVPILFRGDSTLLDERGPLRSLARRAFLRWVYRHVDVALYAGALNRDYFLAHGLGENQLVWAPHAVDNARFSGSAASGEAAAQEWRGRLGIPDGATVFLMPAKLVERKDPVTLLKAFLDLTESRPGEAHLIFVGDGALDSSLRAQAAGRRDVHFTGFQNQAIMPTVYRLADVIVLPSSRGETWGLAINEGMACGRPAIVSDRVGCGKDLINAGHTGFVFEHGDTGGLKQSMTHFVEDRGRAAAMGDQARKLIEAWTVDAYTTVVADVTRSRSRSSSITTHAPLLAQPSSR